MLRKHFGGWKVDVRDAGYYPVTGFVIGGVGPSVSTTTVLVL
jgi:hypothetical protein